MLFCITCSAEVIQNNVNSALLLHALPVLIFIPKLSLGHPRQAGERSGGRCPKPSALKRLVLALSGAGRLSERTPQAASAKGIATASGRDQTNPLGAFGANRWPASGPGNSKIARRMASPGDVCRCALHPPALPGASGWSSASRAGAERLSSGAFAA
jgi:hypothetical protein